MINLIIFYSFTWNLKITYILWFIFVKKRWAMIGYRHEFPIEKIYIVIEIRKNELISTEVDNLNKYIFIFMVFLICFGFIQCSRVTISLRNAILESGCADEGKACFVEDTCCPGLVCKWYTVGSGTCLKNVFWLLFWTSSRHHTVKNGFLLFTFRYIYERYLINLTKEIYEIVKYML